jgi:hypothetical protein
MKTLTRLARTIRFQKVVRSADRAATPGEAEAAANAARRLMEAYQIDPVILYEGSFYDQDSFANSVTLARLRAEHLRTPRGKAEQAVRDKHAAMLARRRERYRRKQEAKAGAEWEEYLAYRKEHPLDWSLADIFGIKDEDGGQPTL